MLLNTGNLEIAVFLVMQLDLISQELTGHLPAGPRRAGRRYGADLGSRWAGQISMERPTDSGQVPNLERGRGKFFDG